LISQGAGGGELKSRVLVGMGGVAVVYLLTFAMLWRVKRPPLKRELENQALWPFATIAQKAFSCTTVKGVS
jgi:hypothetical protein